MNTNKILELLCSRFGELQVVDTIDYPRIEELCYLTVKVLDEMRIEALNKEILSSSNKQK